MLEGISTFYYDNGSKQLEAFYQNDVLNGKITRWSFNGTKESVENYKTGLREGLSTTWNTTRVKLEERTYHNDTLNGPYKLYHDSGELKIEGNYNMGLFDGNWTYYNEFGFRIGDGKYKLGKGIQRAFHQNGSLWIEIPYSENKRNGTGKEFDSSGKLIKESVFENDVLVSVKENQER
jgi:antitoxin component YwqK of YwqJK toxin-antitoxin module